MVTLAGDRDRRQDLPSQAAPGGHRRHALAPPYADRYIEYLFGHPVARGPDGRVRAVLERTNNVADHVFSIAKQQLRQRLGRARLGRVMEDRPVPAANLPCPHDVRIVCLTLARLPQAIAVLDRQAVRASTPLRRNNKDAALRKRIRAWAAADGQ